MKFLLVALGLSLGVASPLAARVLIAVEPVTTPAAIRQLAASTCVDVGSQLRFTLVLAPGSAGIGVYRGCTLRVLRHPVAPAQLRADHFDPGATTRREWTDHRLIRIDVDRDELPNAYVALSFVPRDSHAEVVDLCVPLTDLAALCRDQRPPAAQVPAPHFEPAPYLPEFSFPPLEIPAPRRTNRRGR